MKREPTDSPSLERRAAAWFIPLVALATLAAAWTVGAQVWRIGVRDEWQWAYYGDSPVVLHRQYLPTSVRPLPSPRDEAGPHASRGLRVFLYPPAVREDGARWRVDGRGWLSSGQTAEQLAPGKHRVEYLPLREWGAPPAETVQTIPFRAPWAPAAPVAVFSAFLCIALLLVLRRGIKTVSEEVAVVLLCLGLALGVVMSLGTAAPAGRYEMIPRLADPWTAGYYAEAVRIDDMGGYLRRYPERIARLSLNEPFGHLGDHPPGPVVFHWALNRLMHVAPALSGPFLPADSDELDGMLFLTQRSAQAPINRYDLAGLAASAFLFRLAAWLMLVPVYLIARELGSPRAGLIALGLALFVPALHIFGPYPDQVFPLIAVFAFYAWLKAMRRRNLWWAAVSGATLCIGMLWTVAFLAIVALLGTATALRLRQEYAAAKARPAWRDGVRLGLAWLNGFAVVALLPVALFGYDVYRVWMICLSQHAGFAALFKRSYLPWALFNPVEFVLFAGVVASFAMTLAAAVQLRHWRIARRQAALPILPWALLLVLAALNFSGKNLGEVGRLWLFLMPFAAVSAAAILDRLDGGRGWPATAAIALSAVQATVFRLNIDGISLA